MRLSLQTFTTLVQNAAASVQASSTQLLDLTVGSALRAILEANASLGLWMQWLVVQVMQVTRAATSAGADLDSWIADFGVTRLPAVAATGMVVFSRYTTLNAATVPVGTLVRTQDGSQTFVVTASPAVAGYSQEQAGYVLVPGAASMSVPVAAQVAGQAGNVLAGTIGLIVTPASGIDTVTNPSAFSGGIDLESDAAVRTRFQGFLSSRAQATAQAVAYAVAGVQQGLTYVIEENIDPAGAVRPGNFVVTVDDGSGAPSSLLLGAVSEAVSAVRPVGTTFSVQGPAVLSAAVAMTLTLSPGIDRSAAVAAVTAAVQSYIDRQPVGAALALTRLSQLAYDAVPQISNVTDVTINGLAADLIVPAAGVVKAATVVVS